jgi:hypothetical protein
VNCSYRRRGWKNSKFENRAAERSTIIFSCLALSLNVRRLSFAALDTRDLGVKMLDRPTGFFLLVIASAVVWTAKDLLQNIGAVPPQAWLLVVSAVIALLPGWVAWRARENWRPAVVGTVALSVGMQLGKILSDAISGIDWSASGTWSMWGFGWLVLFARNGLLVLTLSFLVRWVQRRRRER